MNRRRVLLVTDYQTPYIGGMEMHAEECVRYFSAQDELAGVCLMPLGGWDEARTHFTESTGFRDPTMLSEASIHSVEELAEAIVHCGGPEHLTIFFNSLYWIRMLGDLKRRFPTMKIFLRSGGNDILQARIEGAGDTLLARQMFIAQQLTAHADGLIVNSEFSRGRFLALGVPEERMSIVSGGVDISRFKPVPRGEKARLRTRLGLSQDVTIILAACRLVPFKGFIETLTMLKDLETKTPFIYIIIGNGPERTKIEQHVRSASMQDKIHLLDAISHTTLPGYFQAADIYSYFPKLERMHEQGGSYVHTETMGRSFCEAMAAGLPVVTSNVGGIGEVVHSGVHGFLVDSDDDTAKSTALARLIDSPDERALMGHAARQYAEKRYSWKTVCAEYHRLFSL